MKKGSVQKIIIAVVIAVLIVLSSLYILSSIDNQSNISEPFITEEEPSFFSNLKWYHFAAGVIAMIIIIFFILWILSRLEAFKK